MPEEGTLYFSNTPITPIVEGICEMGQTMLGMIEDEDDQIYDLYNRYCNVVSTNLAFACNGDGLDVAGAVEQLIAQAYVTRRFAEGYVQFLTHPLWCTSFPHYWYGSEFIRDCMQRMQGNLLEFYRMVYTEPHTVQTLRAGSRPCVRGSCRPNCRPNCRHHTWRLEESPMALYILRRLMQAIPTLMLAITLVFFAFQLIPGDVARMFAGEQAPVEAVERLRKEMGLDRPVWEQYTTYLGRLLSGNLGTSFITGRPVSQEIADRFWNTVVLACLAITLATVLGLAMGIVSAIHRESFWDYLFSIISLVGLSIPVFWLGLMLMLLLSVQWGILPTAGNQTWQHYIMPTFVLAVYSIAFITRMTRSSLLEMLGKDFARTAYAKGLPNSVVLMRHVLRNAMIPIVTVVGLRFGYMLGGAVIVETIFAWPGMGRLLVTAVAQRDIPVVQGVLLVVAVMFVFVNLLIDVCYALIDPRIEYR